MRLEHLYCLRFTYSAEWGVSLTGTGGTEGQYFFLADGSCEGRVSGRFQGANHPRRRTDGTFVPDFQGVIETTDGATICFDYQGYGRAYPAGRRQIVASATHLSEDERYRWLNDVVCVMVGEVRTRSEAAGQPGAGTELVIEVAELIWEPIAE